MNKKNTNRKNSLVSLLAFFMLAGAGCSNTGDSAVQNSDLDAKVASEPQFGFRASHKSFGEQEEETSAAKPQNKLVKWAAFDDGMEKAKSENKFVMIKFYTDWCMYCKKLDDETFSDKKIADYLNNKFVAVSVNAESQNKVVFEGKTITEQQLAQAYGVAGYPTLVFLETEKEVIGHVPQFVDVNDFYTIASYVATGSFKNQTIDQYKEKLQKT